MGWLCEKGRLGNACKQNQSVREWCRKLHAPDRLLDMYSAVPFVYQVAINTNERCVALFALCQLRLVVPLVASFSLSLPFSHLSDRWRRMKTCLATYGRPSAGA